jgi:hypothetical protein
MLSHADRLSLLEQLRRQVESTSAGPRALGKFQRTIDPAFGIWADRTDLPEDSSDYVRQLRKLQGKFRGKGLMKALMAEKKREKDL